MSKLKDLLMAVVRRTILFGVIASGASAQVVLFNEPFEVPATQLDLANGRPSEAQRPTSAARNSLIG